MKTPILNIDTQEEIGTNNEKQTQDTDFNFFDFFASNNDDNNFNLFSSTSNDTNTSNSSNNDNDFDIFPLNDNEFDKLLNEPKNDINLNHQVLAIDNKKRKLTGGEESKKGNKLTKVSNNLALKIIENLNNDFEKKEINTEKQIINNAIKIDEIDFKDEATRIALLRIHIQKKMQQKNSGKKKTEYECLSNVDLAKIFNVVITTISKYIGKANQNPDFNTIEENKYWTEVYESIFNDFKSKDNKSEIDPKDRINLCRIHIQREENMRMTVEQLGKVFVLAPSGTNHYIKKAKGSPNIPEKNKKYWQEIYEKYFANSKRKRIKKTNQDQLQHMEMPKLSSTENVLNKNEGNKMTDKYIISNLNFFQPAVNELQSENNQKKLEDDVTEFDNLFNELKDFEFKDLDFN